jgi:glycosyltransferase involved in cell wall biosynthesis
MALGVPPVALATTEAPMILQHNVSGFVDTNVDRLIQWMELLLRAPQEARRIGDNARQVARTRFAIERFARDWDRTLTDFVARRTGARVGRNVEEQMEILR